MKIRPISEWTLYRWRFLFAYGLLAAIILALLLIYPNQIPPGLSQQEQQSVIDSAAISFTQLPTNIVDIPYHALQKLSVEYFGLTPLGVRLPSLVFGALTALCLMVVLRRWFKTNVAVSSAVIVLTTAWFIGMARLGAPIIMIPFWTSVLLLAATYISQETKSGHLWQLLFALAAALSLYTPFMIYLFVAVGLASFTQPHVRYLIREGSKANLFVSGFFFVLVIGLLGWGVYKDPNQLRTLLAIPSELPDPLQFAKDLWAAINNFMNPFNVQTGEFITPAIGLATAALLAIGASRLLRDFHSIRAHVLLTWAAVLIPVVALNPNNLAVVFVPALLTVCVGLNQVIRYWYRIFPRNPYARIFGLLPLGVLLFAIVQFNYQRYVFGMLYSPQAVSAFDRDPFMAQAAVTEVGQTDVTLVVPEHMQSLYNVMASSKAHKANVIVGTDKSLPTERQGRWIVAISLWPDVKREIPGTFAKHLVTDTRDNGLRFWVYQR